MIRVLLATRNGAKLAELRRILDSAGVAGIEVVGLDALPPFRESPETGVTFEENAITKASEAAEHTGLPAVADDSGLAIDALNGMPGVFSARWSGKHGDDQANLELVLAQLADVPEQRRQAAFVSAAALARPGDESTVVRGEWRGRIIREARGSSGFGYDPIFVPEDHTRTSAELSPAEKDAASHRGRALRLLLPHLRLLAS